MPHRALVVGSPGEARSRLVDALVARGFDVQAAEGGEAALPMVASGDPRTVVVTLGDDGDADAAHALRFVRNVRSRADTAGTAVVGVAWQRRAHLAEDTLEAGADDYLVSRGGDDYDELVARLIAQVRARRRPRHAIAGEVQARADVIASIEVLVGDGRPHESALSAACRAALSLRGVIGAGVLALDEPDSARMIATAGRTPVPIQSGDVFDPATAASLWQRATAGPWFQPSLTEPGWLAIAPISDGGVVAAFGLWFTPTAVADDDQRAVALATAMDLAAAMRPLVAPILRGRSGVARRRLHTDDLLQSGAFTPVFQPIVAIGESSSPESTVVGYEALTRFHDATPPDQRFAAAAHVGRREALEVAAVQAAVEKADQLPAGGWLSLNLSASTIVSHRDALTVHFATTNRPIVIEITEHEPISDYPSLRAAMAAIDRRPAVCVDDAGSGYASLQHVAALEPEYIKLDRSWVRGITQNRVRQAIVAGMREFATRAGVELIAEGVEEESELETLRSLGISMAQGYLLGRPAPAPPAPG